MTPRMEKFAHEYLRNGGNGVQAAMVAGYKGNKANLASRSCQLLSVEGVADILREHSKKACEKTELTVEMVLRDLENAKTMAKDGYETLHGTRKDVAAYIKAVELQGKYLKMWVERIEVEASGHLELMKVIKKREEDGAA